MAVSFFLKLKPAKTFSHFKFMQNEKSNRGQKIRQQLKGDIALYECFVRVLLANSVSRGTFSIQGKTC